MGDLGVQATYDILDDLKAKVKEKHIKEPMECRELLIESIKEQMDIGETAYEFENHTSVVMVIGVNGVGKTNFSRKDLQEIKKNQGEEGYPCSSRYFPSQQQESSSLSGRTAQVWRSSADRREADPASVIYDAVAAAKARNADVLLCDTAGRLHNKKNLMEELRKIYRILEREYPDAYLETLVVLDGTTGQNALAQARQFAEVANVSGIILTKLDGTAKGGIAVAIQSELDIPVKYIGVGESIDDLQKFDADAFVNALFDVDHKENPDA